MKKRAAVVLTTLVLIGVDNLVLLDTADAGSPFNMMNPSRWFGGNRNYDDYYDDGYYGGPGYGYGAPGYGYGAPGYGYAPPGYGYGVPVQPAPAAPAAPSGEDASAKIKALEDRIKQLEASQSRPVPMYESDRYQNAPQAGSGSQSRPAPMYQGGRYQNAPQAGNAPQSAPYTAPPSGSNYITVPGSSFRPTN